MQNCKSCYTLCEMDINKMELGYPFEVIDNELY